MPHTFCLRNTAFLTVPWTCWAVPIFVPLLVLLPGVLSPSFLSERHPLYSLQSAGCCRTSYGYPLLDFKIFCYLFSSFPFGRWVSWITDHVWLFFISPEPGIFPLRYGLHFTKVEWIVPCTLVMPINPQTVYCYVCSFRDFWFWDIKQFALICSINKWQTQNSNAALSDF